MTRRILSSVILGLAVFWAAASTTAQPAEVSPVTDAMLAAPSPDDWLHWRRTHDGWGYSPLDQINRDNVHLLQLVWSSPLPQGLSQPTPLVYDGVMYVPNPRGVVQALDAATGDRLWEYRKTFEGTPDETFRSRTRSLAIYGDKIYVTTSDAHIVALDARTGRVVWDHTVADYRRGYRYTSGVIVVNGTLIAGMTGCERYTEGGCFISAHDPETGTELWRTATIAGPGEPGGDTWGDLPAMFRAGGDAWIPGSYDPVLDRIYWGTAQATKPWARVSRGTDGDALYTNSVLALDPTTGALDWYYQFIPGESHDLDEAFESVLIDREGRRSMFKMGKLGILWELGPRDRGVRGGARSRVSDAGRRRSKDRGGDLPAGDDSPGRCGAGVLPRAVRHQELAGDGVSSRDERAVYPDSSELHEGGLQRRGTEGSAVRGLVLLSRSQLQRVAGDRERPASTQPRPRRPSGRDGRRHRGGVVAALGADARPVGGVDHRRGPGGRRGW